MDTLPAPDSPYFCIDCGLELYYEAQGEPPEKCEECSVPQTGPGSPLLERFAGNVREIRERSGMGAKAVSLRAGLSPSAVTVIEGAISEPMIGAAVGIAGVLGVAVDDLVEGIHWYPGEMARRSGQYLDRKSASRRLRGFFSVSGRVDPGDADLREATEPVETKQAALELLGGNLKRIREGRNLSRKELARRASVHRQVVSQIERASTEPMTETIIKLARPLEVGFADLFAGIEWLADGALRTSPKGAKRKQRALDVAVVDLWNDGETIEDIADALGVRFGDVASLVHRLREEGAWLPYRREAMSDQQEAARLRRTLLPRQARAVDDEVDLGEDVDDEVGIGPRIGINVRHYKQRAGLSHTQFSEGIEADRSVVSNIERGGFRNIRLSLFLKLASTLNVAYDLLLEGVSWSEERGCLVVRPPASDQAPLSSGAAPSRSPR